ncbi:MAG TPA: phosphopantetheine-binding protein [Flexilinea sp.]|nr:phosphopantetheine-binding protein [Flexilinea sp.]HOW06545.1 phosphopantetheine-binding protein [Flexilinea sp.]HPS48191.1 phosphopantetheine-binding protein [Flexilinea sp.]HQG88549.1 phosphopantetheine-binding protein [Flexilinea sp.]HRY20218.1 phosphopantetheine-binding protein [Flexilinea sp.]
MIEIVDILIDKIKNEILNQPNRKLKSDTPLISSGLIDSFHLVDLALMIEDTFGVHIEDYELRSDIFDTVEDLALLIDSRMS